MIDADAHAELFAQKLEPPFGDYLTLNGDPCRKFLRNRFISSLGSMEDFRFPMKTKP